MQRLVRLKEHAHNKFREFRHEQVNLEKTNGTLPTDLLVFRTDQNGFIDNGNGTFDGNDIILLGDSVIESYNISEKARLPSVVERLVRMQKDVRVCNAGYSGMTLLHAINVFVNKIIPMKPRTVILTVSSIDQHCCVREIGFWSTNPYLNPLVAKDGNLPENQDELIPFNTTQRDQLLSVFRNTAEIFGIKIFITTDAAMPETDWFKANAGRFDLYNKKRQHQLIQESTRKFCTANGIYLIDVEAELDTDGNYFYDLVHYNEMGAKAAGEIIARHLLQSGAR